MSEAASPIGIANVSCPWFCQSVLLQKLTFDFFDWPSSQINGKDQSFTICLPFIPILSLCVNRHKIVAKRGAAFTIMVRNSTGRCCVDSFLTHPRLRVNQV